LPPYYRQVGTNPRRCRCGQGASAMTEIEGAPAKPYRLCRVTEKGEFVSIVAEANTFEELTKVHKRRPDWHYKTFYKRMPID
jgi:hypothetical protein